MHGTQTTLLKEIITLYIRKPDGMICGQHCTLFQYFCPILFYFGLQRGQGLSERVIIPPTAEEKNTVSLPEVETRCYLTHSGYETNIRNISSDTFIFPVAWPPTDQTHDRSCRYVGPTQSRRTQCGERHIWPYQIALAHINPLMLQCEVVKSMRPFCSRFCPFVSCIMTSYCRSVLSCVLLCHLPKIVTTVISLPSWL